MELSNVYVVRFTVEVEASGRDEAEQKACTALQESPELAEVYDVERLWVLE